MQNNQDLTAANAEKALADAMTPAEQQATKVPKMNMQMIKGSKKPKKKTFDEQIQWIDRYVNTLMMKCEADLHMSIQTEMQRNIRKPILIVRTNVMDPMEKMESYRNLRAEVEATYHLICVEDPDIKSPVFEVVNPSDGEAGEVEEIVRVAGAKFLESTLEEMKKRKAESEAAVAEKIATADLSGPEVSAEEEKDIEDGTDGNAPFAHQVIDAAKESEELPVGRINTDSILGKS